MASYRLSLRPQSSTAKLEDYEYKVRGRDESSLQKLIAENPDVIKGLPELELTDSEILFALREYPTTRGSIDLLIITENAEIVIVETKLIKSPEATRNVVAQAIDYIKAFSNETVDNILDNLSRKKINTKTDLEKIKNDERFMTLLENNIKTGNFQVLILGDVIHPNILGMVESIQSAPHLSFTIYLVELNAVFYDENTIIITPKIVANTLEVERSVIRIEIGPKGSLEKIESEVPSKEGKGSKQVLTWEQFLDNISNKEVRNIIEDFKRRWISEIDDSISMGQVGFSAGLNYGNKRIPIQYVYDRQVNIISETMKEACNIPDGLYREYKEELKKFPEIFDKYLIGNRVGIKFDMIDAETLKFVLNASLKLARKIKNVQ